jgi:aldose 1-epimerase
MFVINKIPFGKTTLLELRNNVTNEYATILPEIGASLHQICLVCDNVLHPLLWAVKDEDELHKEGIPQYMGALLFPFVDRLENGKYVFEEVEYTLPCNEENHKNSLHGFMNNNIFQVLQLSANQEQASAELFYNYEGTFEGYPFSCTITVCYTLNAKGFDCSTSVKNKSGGNMPIGMGWHPYFLLTENPSQYEVSVPAMASFIIREDYINTGKKVSFDKREEFLKINNFAFNAYALNQVNDSTKTILRDKKNKTDITIESRGFPYLQLYVVAEKAIAIEPLTCMGNSFNNGIGLTILAPNEIMKNSFEVKLFPVDR